MTFTHEKAKIIDLKRSLRILEFQNIFILENISGESFPTGLRLQHLESAS